MQNNNAHKVLKDQNNNAHEVLKDNHIYYTFLHYICTSYLFHHIYDPLSIFSFANVYEVFSAIHKYFKIYGLSYLCISCLVDIFLFHIHTSNS